MPHLATCVDDICFLRSCWCTSTIHAPAMYELHTGRTLMGFPSLGVVGDVRPRQREREPAGVLRDAAAGGRARGRRAVLAAALPAGGLPGHAAPQGAEPDPEPEAAGRTSAASRTGATFDLVKQAERSCRPAAGRRRARGPHRQLRTRLPDAAARPGGGRSGEGDRGDDEGLRPRRRADGRLRHAAAARAAAGRARRAVRAGVLRRRPARHAVGRPRRHQRQPREDVRPRRSADRGAAEGPEAARAC